MTFVFFFFSIIVCAMVVINMVVGVFVDCYNNQVGRIGRNEPPLLKAMMPVLVHEPDRGIRHLVYRVLALQSFDMMIAFFIVMNVLAMAVDSFKKATWQQDLDMITNIFFSIVFGTECILKLWTLRMKQYYDNNWNRFDFFIVSISFVGIIIDNLQDVDPVVLRIVRIFRMLRILRAFRIFKAFKALFALVKVILYALPAMANLVSFLMLFFFIWSVLGVQLYSQMCMVGDEAKDPPLRSTRCLLINPDNLLPRQMHFQSVEWAFLTLFRVSTGDAWGDVTSSLSLATGSRSARIEDDVWEYFTSLYGGIEASFLIKGLSQDSKDARIQLAGLALRSWNQTMTRAIPIDNVGAVADAFAAAARLALPGCITQEEADSLVKLKLMDCSVELEGQLYASECLPTCGYRASCN